ncbi:MAG: hypothetical protein HY593_04305, partial [Candidatus Omnitrophica bacterium]|nr:hypothetical protein [Candidatus Omnitrophota bacterium]
YQSITADRKFDAQAVWQEAKANALGGFAAGAVFGTVFKTVGLMVKAAQEGKAAADVLNKIADSYKTLAANTSFASSQTAFVMAASVTTNVAVDLAYGEVRSGWDLLGSAVRGAVWGAVFSVALSKRGFDLMKGAANTLGDIGRGSVNIATLSMKQAAMWPMVTLGFAPATSAVDALFKFVSTGKWEGLKITSKEGQRFDLVSVEGAKELGRQMIEAPLEGRMVGPIVHLFAGGQMAIAGGLGNITGRSVVKVLDEKALGMRIAQSLGATKTGGLALRLYGNFAVGLKVGTINESLKILGFSETSQQVLGWVLLFIIPSRGLSGAEKSYAESFKKEFGAATEKTAREKLVERIQGDLKFVRENGGGIEGFKALAQRSHFTQRERDLGAMMEASRIQQALEGGVTGDLTAKMMEGYNKKHREGLAPVDAESVRNGTHVSKEVDRYNELYGKGTELLTAESLKAGDSKEALTRILSERFDRDLQRGDFDGARGALEEMTRVTGEERADLRQKLESAVKENLGANTSYLKQRFDYLIEEGDAAGAREILGKLGDRLTPEERAKVEAKLLEVPTDRQMEFLQIEALKNADKSQDILYRFHESLVKGDASRVRMLMDEAIGRGMDVKALGAMASGLDRLQRLEALYEKETTRLDYKVERISFDSSVERLQEFIGRDPSYLTTKDVTELVKPSEAQTVKLENFGNTEFRRDTLRHAANEVVARELSFADLGQAASTAKEVSFRGASVEVTFALREAAQRRMNALLDAATLTEVALQSEGEIEFGGRRLEVTTEMSKIAYKDVQQGNTDLARSARLEVEKIEKEAFGEKTLDSIIEGYYLVQPLAEGRRQWVITTRGGEVQAKLGSWLIQERLEIRLGKRRSQNLDTLRGFEGVDRAGQWDKVSRELGGTLDRMEAQMLLSQEGLARLKTQIELEKDVWLHPDHAGRLESYRSEGGRTQWQKSYRDYQKVYEAVSKVVEEYAVREREAPDTESKSALLSKLMSEKKLPDQKELTDGTLRDYGLSRGDLMKENRHFAGFQKKAETNTERFIEISRQRALIEIRLKGPLSESERANLRKELVRLEAEFTLANHAKFRPVEITQAQRNTQKHQVLTAAELEAERFDIKPVKELSEKYDKQMEGIFKKVEGDLLKEGRSATPEDGYREIDNRLKKGDSSVDVSYAAHLREEYKSKPEKLAELRMKEGSINDYLVKHGEVLEKRKAINSLLKEKVTEENKAELDKLRGELKSLEEKRNEMQQDLLAEIRGAKNPEWAMLFTEKVMDFAFGKKPGDLAGGMTAAQRRLIATFASGKGAVLEAGAGKTEAALAFMEAMGMIYGEKASRMIIVDTAEAAARYVHGSAGQFARAEIAEILGSKLVNGADLAKNNLDKLVDSITGKDSQNNVIVIDYTSLGHLYNSPRADVLAAIRKFNLIVVDEVHVPVTGRQAYIVAGEGVALASTVEGLKQIADARKLHQLVADPSKVGIFTGREGEAQVRGDNSERAEVYFAAKDAPGEKVLYNHKSLELFKKETGLLEGEILMFLHGMRDVRAEMLEARSGYSVKDGFLYPNDMVGKTAYESRISDTNYKLGLALEHNAKLGRGEFGKGVKEVNENKIDQATTENYTSLLQIFARPKSVILGMTATAESKKTLITTGIGSDIETITATKVDLSKYRTDRSFAVGMTEAAIREIDVSRVTDRMSLRQQNRAVDEFVAHAIRTMEKGESSVVIASMDTVVRSKLEAIFGKILDGSGISAERLVTIGAKDAAKLNEAAKSAGPGAKDNPQNLTKIHITNEQGYTGVDWRGRLELHVLGAEKMSETALGQLTYRTGRTTDSQDARFVDLTAGRFKTERYLYADTAAAKQELSTLKENGKLREALEELYKSTGDETGLRLIRQLGRDALTNENDQLTLLVKVKDNVERGEAIEFAMSDTLKGRMVIQVLKKWIEAHRQKLGDPALLPAERGILEKDLKILENKFREVVNVDARGSGLVVSDSIAGGLKRAERIFESTRMDAERIFTELLEGRTKSWEKTDRLSKEGGLLDAVRSLRDGYKDLRFDKIEAAGHDSFAKAQDIETVVGVAKFLARQMLPRGGSGTERFVETQAVSVKGAIAEAAKGDAKAAERLENLLRQNPAYVHVYQDPETGEKEERLTREGRVVFGIVNTLQNSADDDRYDAIKRFIAANVTSEDGKPAGIAPDDSVAAAQFLVGGGILSLTEDVRKALDTLRDVARIHETLSPKRTLSVESVRTVLTDAIHTDKAIHKLYTETLGFGKEETAMAMHKAHRQTAIDAQGSVRTQTALDYASRAMQVLTFRNEGGLKNFDRLIEMQRADMKEKAKGKQELEQLERIIQQDAAKAFAESLKGVTGLNPLAEYGLLYRSVVELERLGKADPWVLNRMKELEKAMGHRQDISLTVRIPQVDKDGNVVKDASGQAKIKEVKTLQFKGLSAVMEYWAGIKADHAQVTALADALNKAYERYDNVSPADGQKDSVDYFRFSTKEERETDPSKPQFYALNMIKALSQDVNVRDVVSGEEIKGITRMAARQIDFLEAYHPDLFQRAENSKGTSLVIAYRSNLGQYVERTFLPQLNGEMKYEDEVVADLLRAMKIDPHQSVQAVMDGLWDKVLSSHEFQHVRDDRNKENGYFGRADALMRAKAAQMGLDKNRTQELTQLAHGFLVEALPHLRSAFEENGAHEASLAVVYQLFTYLTAREARHYQAVAFYVFSEWAKQLGMKGELFKAYTPKDVIKSMLKQGDPAQFVRDASKALYDKLVQDPAYFAEAAVQVATGEYNKQKSEEALLDERKAANKEMKTLAEKLASTLSPVSKDFKGALDSLVEAAVGPDGPAVQTALLQFSAGIASEYAERKDADQTVLENFSAEMVRLIYGVFPAVTMPRFLAVLEGRRLGKTLNALAPGLGNHFVILEALLQDETQSLGRLSEEFTRALDDLAETRSVDWEKAFGAEKAGGIREALPVVMADLSSAAERIGAGIVGYPLPEAGARLAVEKAAPPPTPMPPAPPLAPSIAGMQVPPISGARLAELMAGVARAELGFTLPQYLEAALAGTEVKMTDEWKDLFGRFERSVLQANLEEEKLEEVLFTPGATADLERMRNLYPGMDFKAMLLKAVEEHLFANAVVTRVIEATRRSQAHLLHADFIVNKDGTVNPDSANLIRAMSQALNKGPFAVVVSKTDPKREAVEARLAGLGVQRVLLADSVEEIRSGLERVGMKVERFVVAVKSEDSLVQMVDSALSYKLSPDQFVVVDKDYDVGYKALAAPFVVGDDKVLAVGDFKIKSDAVRGFFSRFAGLIRLIRAPWEALKDLYRAIRASAAAA